MIVTNVRQVAKHLAANLVLDRVSIEIHDDSRIGLVGPNGAGKSTLMRIIAGVETRDEGWIETRRGTRVAYLPQEIHFPPGSTVLDEALKAREYLSGFEDRLRALEERMASEEVYEDPEMLQRTIDQHEVATRDYESAGGLNVDGRVTESLRSVGFADRVLTTPAETLSGGQKKLLYLARLLATEPNLLLLDEPDNHMDLAAKQRLERLIVDYPGAVVIVSHDRYLLDVVAETIAELEIAGQHPGRPQLTTFNGNYSEFAAEKRLALLRQQQDYELQQRERGRLERSMRRLLSWSNGENEKFVRRAHNIERRLDRMELIEKPILEPKRIGLQLESERGGFKVLTVAGLSKAFGDLQVLDTVDLLITHGERVALTGANGSGKSVLFRLILGEEQADSGEATTGARIRVGYYAQEQDTLDPELTPVDEVRSVRGMHESDAYAFLGSFLFDFHKARRPVSSLSGGEKARLQMAKLMLAEGNLLLLDEPTNNLDIPSCEALEDAIDDYEGTVFVISHDRYFLDRVAGRVVELADGRLSEVAK